MARRKKSSDTTLAIFLFGIVVSSIAVSSTLFKDFISLLLLILIHLVLLVALILVLILWYNKKKDEKKFKALDISQIDEMSGREFEKYLAKVLEGRGYNVELTRTTGDFGGDIIARKDHERISIQVKRYNAPVGLGAVQEALGAMMYYKCNKAMVITNRSFTKQAEQLADASNCDLIDRDKLAEWILDFQEGRDPR